MQEDVIEVTNQIPYHRIQHLHLLKVTYDGKILHIHYQIKYLEQTQQQHHIQRKLSDLNQLIHKMKQQHPSIILIPQLPNQSSLIWDHIKGLKNYLSKPTEKQKQQNQKQNKYIERYTQRALQFLSKMTLKFLYRVVLTNNSPLFSFLHPKFSLYSSPIYQKQPTGKLQKITGLFKSGSKRFFDYYSKQQKYYQALNQIQNELSGILQKTNKFQTLFSKLEKDITDLSTNLLTLHEKLSKRSFIIYSMFLKINYLGKYIQIIIDETKQISNRVKSIQNGDNHKQIQEQLNIYQNSIKDQIIGLNKQLVNQIKQFYVKFNKQEQQVQIDIKQIYTNYKIVKQ